MAPPAANALLKTLEEPPARTLFVLCTTAPEQLLPTIRVALPARAVRRRRLASRCRSGARRADRAARRGARSATPRPDAAAAGRRGQRRCGAGARRGRAGAARARARSGGARRSRRRAARGAARADDPVVAHRGRDPQREPAARDRGRDRAARGRRSTSREPTRIPTTVRTTRPTRAAALPDGGWRRADAARRRAVDAAAQAGGARRSARAAAQARAGGAAARAAMRTAAPQRQPQRQPQQQQPQRIRSSSSSSAIRSSGNRQQERQPPQRGRSSRDDRSRRPPRPARPGSGDREPARWTRDARHAASRGADARWRPRAARGARRWRARWTGANATSATATSCARPRRRASARRDATRQRRRSRTRACARGGGDGGASVDDRGRPRAATIARPASARDMRSEAASRAAIARDRATTSRRRARARWPAGRGATTHARGHAAPSRRSPGRASDDDAPRPRRARRLGHRRRRAGARDHACGRPAADAPADDPDPVTCPLVDGPGAQLGDDVASVVGVRFVPAGRIPWCDAGDADYAPGERVMVDSERGPRLAWIATAPPRRATRDRGLRRVMRRANEHDLRGERDGEPNARRRCAIAKDKAAALRLPLKVFRVEKAGRPQAQRLLHERRAARPARLRPRRRQRDRLAARAAPARRARRGEGGRRHRLVRAHAVLHDVAARLRAGLDQDGQGSGARAVADEGVGQCGRLKCCLVYEQAGYAEMRKGLPKLGKRVIGARGEGRVVEVDVLRQRVRVSYGRVTPRSCRRPRLSRCSRRATSRRSSDASDARSR